MRILHVDETFHPSFGYQCNPLAKFQAREGNEVFILAPEAKYIYTVYRSFGEYGVNLEKEDRQYEIDTGVKILRVKANGWIMGRLNYDLGALFRAIDSVNPDVMLVHCMETLTAMRILRRLHKRYPMVLDSHMLSMASKNRFSRLFENFYKAFCTSVIVREKLTVIKTQNDDYVSTHLGVPEEQTKFISFGTDTVHFFPDKSAKTEFLEKNELSQNTFVIVSTGKLNAQKDGQLFAKAMKHAFNNRPVAVVVVANFSSEYEIAVKKELELSQNKVLFFPVQNYLNLPWFYQIGDVTVFPKQCSMSFYDAQSCGCPVISEKGNVNEDRNSHGNGLCFEGGNADDLRAKIQTIIDMPEDEYRIMRENSLAYAQLFSYEIIAKEYTRELEKAYEAFRLGRR